MSESKYSTLRLNRWKQHHIVEVKEGVNKNTRVYTSLCGVSRTEWVTRYDGVSIQNFSDLLKLNEPKYRHCKRCLSEFKKLKGEGKSE